MQMRVIRLRLMQWSRRSSRRSQEKKKKRVGVGWVVLQSGKKRARSSAAARPPQTTTRRPGGKRQEDSFLPQHSNATRVRMKGRKTEREKKNHLTKERQSQVCRPSCHGNSCTPISLFFIHLFIYFFKLSSVMLPCLTSSRTFTMKTRKPEHRNPTAAERYRCFDTGQGQLTDGQKDARTDAPWRPSDPDHLSTLFKNQETRFPR